MIDGNPLKSHCAQYILPVGLVFGRVIIDDILFDRRESRGGAAVVAGMTLVHDPALDENYPERYTSIVELTLKDGRTCPAGSNSRGERARTRSPPTRCGPSTSADGADRAARAAEAIMTAVDRLDRARDLAPLAALLRQKVGGTRTRD